MTTHWKVHLTLLAGIVLMLPVAFVAPEFFLFCWALVGIRQGYPIIVRHVTSWYAADQSSDRV